MANTWKPKVKVVCSRCDWSGVRAVIARACPSCGHWHPRRVEKGAAVAKGIKRRLAGVRSGIEAELRIGHEGLGMYGRAMQREGYVGGYLQALTDVELALNGIHPDQNGRFCHLWEQAQREGRHG